MDRVGKCNYITWIQWLSGVRIIRNPWFSRVFTRKAKQLVPTLDPRAAATSAAMLEPWTCNCSASYATSCQVFLAMHVACGPSKSFQGGCGVIFKVPTVSRTPYPVGVLFLQGCSSTGIQWTYNETSTSPSSTKTIKIAQNPCYPLFKLFKSIQGPSKHFRDSGFHHFYVSMQNTRWNKLWAEPKNTAVLSLRSLLTFEDHVYWNVQRLNIEERNIWKTMKNCNSWQFDN